MTKRQFILAVLGTLSIFVVALLPNPWNGEVKAQFSNYPSGLSQFTITTASTLDIGEPQPCVTAVGSEWFAWQSPTVAQYNTIDPSGTRRRASIDTNGSTFDTVLAVYVDPLGLGDSYTRLQVIAADDNGGTDGLDSAVSFEVVPGTLYWVQVNKKNSAGGSVKLNYTGTSTSTGAPAGPNCTVPPVVTLSVNPTSGIVGVVNPTITWGVTNNAAFGWLPITACTASGDWSGTKATSSTQSQSLGILNTVKTYTYNLSCYNIAQTSPISTVSVIVNSASPSTPTGLTATASTCGTGLINTSWNASSGATSYTLRDGATVIYTGAATSFAHSGLTNGSSHSYTVMATNSSGSSAYSGSVSGTAPIACPTPSGSISISPTSCTIAIGASSCNTAVTWSTANLTANPTAVTRNNPANTTVSILTSGTNVSNAVIPGISTYYLYHNSVLLATSATITATCAVGSDWVTGVCRAKPTITVTQASNGTIAPSVTTSVVYGTNSTTYSITPNSGYSVASLVIDGSSIAGASSYTFTNITSNRTITATFAPVTVSVTATTPYSTTPNTSVSFAYTPTTNTGATQCRLLNSAQTALTSYQASSPIIFNSSSSVSATGYYVQCQNTTYTSVTALSNLITVNTACAVGSDWVTGVCRAKPTITVTQASNGTITPSGTTSVVYGTNSTVYSITATSGYVVATRIVNGLSTVSTSTSYTFTNITSNQTLSATFAVIILPDLTASVSTPTNAIKDATTTFYATISNSVGTSTGANFSYFFQIASQINGGGTIVDLAPTSTPKLASGGSVAVTSPEYIFTNANNHSVRVCADKSNSASTGTINESNELNNCGAWVNVNVTNATIAPVVSTNTVTGITQTKGTSGGSISSDGGSTVTVSGIVWSTAPISTVGAPVLPTKTTDGSIGGPWTSADMTGLIPGTLYHVRAYATNAVGTGYGADASFTTHPQPIINTFTVLPNPVDVNSTLVFTWSTTNAATCDGSEDISTGWTGSKSVNGSQSIVIAEPGGNRNFTLTCSNSYGESSTPSSAVVSVNSPVPPSVPCTVPQNANLCPLSPATSTIPLIQSTLRDTQSNSPPGTKCLSTASVPVRCEYYCPIGNDENNIPVQFHKVGTSTKCALPGKATER